MAVIAEVTLRGLTGDQYDAVRARAGWLESAPDGELSHLTWWEGEYCHSLAGWESEGAFQDFREQRLAPALADLDLAVAIDVAVHPAHEIVAARRSVVVATGAREMADTLALTRSVYEAFLLGDVPAVLELLARDIVWTTPDSVRFGGRYTGHAGVLEYFSAVQEQIVELHVEPGTYLGAGDAVAVLGRYRGVSRAGRTCEVSWVHLWTWRDGRAAAFTECFDTAKVVPGLERKRTD